MSSSKTTVRTSISFSECCHKWRDVLFFLFLIKKKNVATSVELGSISTIYYNACQTRHYNASLSMMKKWVECGSINAMSWTRAWHLSGVHFSPVKWFPSLSSLCMVTLHGKRCQRDRPLRITKPLPVLLLRWKLGLYIMCNSQRYPTLGWP